MAPAQFTTFADVPSMVSLGETSVVEVTGADAREWLQGQLTQDLRPLTAGGAVRACLCRPTGQLLAHLEVWDLGDRFLLLAHESEAPAFLARVEEAVIMEDVAARVLPASLFHAFGPDAGSLLAQLGADPAAEAPLSPGPIVRARSRTGLPGFDAVLPSGGEHLSHTGGTPVPPGVWNALTLAAGEPLPGVDTNEKTLAPELGPVFEAATVSYRKGCYTGQEILMRLHSRGHTNRTWRGLLSPAPLAAGARIFAEGAEVGRVTRAAEHPTLGPIAGATLRRESAGKRIEAETPDGGRAAVEARDMPLFSLD